MTKHRRVDNKKMISNLIGGLTLQAHLRSNSHMHNPEYRFLSKGVTQPKSRDGQDRGVNHLHDAVETDKGFLTLEIMRKEIQSELIP